MSPTLEPRTYRAILLLLSSTTLPFEAKLPRRAEFYLSYLFLVNLTGCESWMNFFNVELKRRAVFSRFRFNVEFQIQDRDFHNLDMICYGFWRFICQQGVHRAKNVRASGCSSIRFHDVFLSCRLAAPPAVCARCCECINIPRYHCIYEYSSAKLLVMIYEPLRDPLPQ